MSTNLPSASVIRTAWAIRKAEALKHNVRVTFVSWRDCLLKAMGRVVRKIKDCFGSVLGSTRSRINLWLLSPDAPFAIRRGDMVEIGLGTIVEIRSHIWQLMTKGIVFDQHGMFSVNNKFRPYSNLIID